MMAQVHRLCNAVLCDDLVPRRPGVGDGVVAAPRTGAALLVLVVPVLVEALLLLAAAALGVAACMAALPLPPGPLARLGLRGWSMPCGCHSEPLAQRSREGGRGRLLARPRLLRMVWPAPPAENWWPLGPFRWLRRAAALGLPRPLQQQA